MWVWTCGAAQTQCIASIKKTKNCHIDHGNPHLANCGCFKKMMEVRGREKEETKVKGVMILQMFRNSNKDFIKSRFSLYEALIDESRSEMSVFVSSSFY